MLTLKLVSITLATFVICSCVAAQQLDCQTTNSLSQQSPEEWIPIHDACTGFVSSRFTLIDHDEPEYNELVQLCVCTLINKDFKKSDLIEIDKESLWATVEADLFSETGNDNHGLDKQASDEQNEDELDDYFENLIGSEEEVEEEEELQSSGSTNLEREEQMIDLIQLGISKSLAFLFSRPIKDLESRDFSSAEKRLITLPATDRHPVLEFKFKTYAPVVFYHLCERYDIKYNDFFQSLVGQDSRLVPFGNPGRSGSGFYRTHDDKFFIKTEQPNEAKFLIEILPRYYNHFRINPRSLLPQYLGQYSYYASNVRKVRLLAMNNLLPSTVKMNNKYDLKGSTFNRRASSKERAKPSPTFKDLDFRDQHPKGFTVEPAIYNALLETLKKDVNFLRSFKSVDYSLLLGVHKLELETEAVLEWRTTVESFKRTNHFKSIEAIDGNGQKVLLFFGIIDILQNFRLAKRLEKTWKNLVRGSNVSIQNPSFYAQRFYDFITKKVLRPG